MGNFLLALYMFGLVSYHGHNFDHLRVRQPHHRHHHHRHLENFSKCLSESQMKPFEFVLRLDSNDTEARCVLACTLEKDNIMVDNMIDADEAVKGVHSLWAKQNDQERAAKIIRSCVNEAMEEVNNKCDLAYEVSKCSFERFQTMIARKQQIKHE